MMKPGAVIGSVEYGWQKNSHKVPAKQWKKWTNKAREVFNHVYSSMIVDGQHFLHTDAQPVPMEHWKVTAWNAAWTAASAVDYEDTPQVVHK